MAIFSGDHWAFAFGLLGNLISFMVYLAPLPTFYKVYKKKSTEGFQSVPYVVALFSAMLWIYYAFLKPNASLLITINSVGCFIETFYICFFLFYAPKKSRIQTVKILLLLNVVGFGLIVLLTHFLAKGSTRASIVGWICLVFALCVFVAPLGILRKVIQSKSVEFMPFWLSFFLTISAVMWFFYGLLIKDYNIAIPNVLGFSFGILQMGLYVKYKNSKKMATTEQKATTELKAIGEIENQIIVLDQDHKLPELAEQIIDVVMLSAMVCSEIIPADPKVEENTKVDLSVPMQSMGP